MTVVKDDGTGDQYGVDAGFIGTALEGTVVIKNLTIDNAQISGYNRAAGFVGNTYLADLTIINCTFQGSITQISGNGGGNFGGFVGYSNGDVSVVNSYSNASIIRWWIGESDNTGEGDDNGKGSIIAVGGPSATSYCDNVFYTSSYASGCAYGSAAQKTESEIQTAIDNYNQSGIYQYLNVETISDLLPNIKGVTFSKSDDKLIATLNSMAEELYIPTDIVVSKVILDREFDPSVTSTLMLPFSIASSKVENAELFFVSGVDKDGGVAET